MTKTALITGITGQDGSYLADLLLEKGYRVVGLVSQQHGIGETNIKAIAKRLVLEPGDLLDQTSLESIILKHQPNEIYNLAAISFIPASWDKPSLSFNINTLGLTRILEIVKNKLPRARVFQASSAKIFGRPDKKLVDEQTPIKPIDPYAISKAASYFMIQAFREKFDLFACSAIMFNHESPRRGVEFVTRKITRGAVEISLGLKQELLLGDLESEADWGYAPDYVQAMWLMLQQDKLGDFILATGELHQVKEVCQLAFGQLGLDYEKFVKIDDKLVRPKGSQAFAGNPAKVKQKLNWQPKVKFKQLIKLMVDHDREELNHG